MAPAIKEQQQEMPDPNRDRTVGEARGSQWTERDVRALENEVCAGGLRNPQLAKQRSVRLAKAALISKDILCDFIHKNPVYLKLADGGDAAAEVARLPLDELRGRLIEAWAEHTAKEDKTERVTYPVCRADNGSPWRAGVVDAWVAASGDPEVDLALWIRHGTPMGIARRIEARGVFPTVATSEPTREEADAIWVQTSVGGNYKSFEDAGDLARAELQRTIDAGYAKVVGTLADAKRRYGEVAVSKLACIVKDRPDGTKKVRLVVDLRRSLVNALVVAPERIVLPRLRDVLMDAVNLVRECQHNEQIEAMVSDFADAFHSLPIHPDEEKYCLARISGDHFLVFKTVMFGGVSSPLTWGRAGSFLMRGGAALFDKAELLAQCYVDDPIALARGDKETRSKRFSIFILWFLVFGLRMSWKKVARGFRVDWCGASVAFPDRHLVKISLSIEFVKSLEEEVNSIVGKPLVRLVTLRHVVGRATWAFGLVPMLRPVLAPLWAALAELTADAKAYDRNQRTKAKILGRDVAIEVRRILPELLWVRAILRRSVGRGELARTVDARIFVSQSTIRITTDASPWGIGATLEKDNLIIAFLYDKIHEADVKRLSIEVGSSSAQATCEALALLVATRTWLPFWAEERATAVTRSDSLSALGAIAKGSSPSPPINLIVRETALDVACSKYGLEVFKHISGKDNVWADALSRVFAPGGTDALPSILLRPGVVHSKVAERSDAWWEAERLEETLLRRHGEEDSSAASKVVLAKRPLRTPERAREPAKKKNRNRHQRDKARKEREQRPACRLVPGPARQDERAGRASPSTRRSRSRTPRSRGRDATQAAAHARERTRDRSATPRSESDSGPSVIFRARQPHRGAPSMDGGPAEQPARGRPVRRSSSPSGAGPRHGGRHRFEGGHRRFGRRR